MADIDRMMRGSVAIYCESPKDVAEDISHMLRTGAGEIIALRARVARLEGVTRMLIGCIEDTKKYPDMHDDFVDEIETARRALEEK